MSSEFLSLTCKTWTCTVLQKEDVWYPYLTVLLICDLCSVATSPVALRWLCDSPQTGGAAIRFWGLDESSFQLEAATKHRPVHGDWVATRRNLYSVGFI